MWQIQALILCYLYDVSVGLSTHVSNTIPMIEERYYEKIFQTLKPRDEVESSGVGFSIVEKIVELNGGKIG